jgi:hypothetical protein
MRLGNPTHSAIVTLRKLGAQVYRAKGAQHHYLRLPNQRKVATVKARELRALAEALSA